MLSIHLSSTTTAFAFCVIHTHFMRTMSSLYRSVFTVKRVMHRSNHTLINYTRYPLHDRQSQAYRQLVSTNRQIFATSGCMYLPEFLTSHTLSVILDEVNSTLAQSKQKIFHSYEQHTVNLYGTSSYESKSNEKESSSKSLIAFDQIPMDSPLRQLYAWEPLVNFVADIIHMYPCLYRSCDELGALYINVYRQSDKISWHTDHSHFFVNLLLQQPSGLGEGVFEYKTENNEHVVSRNDFRAGGLILFNGRHFAHRVTEIRSSARIGAILTYDPQPDHRLSDYVLQKFFGRTTRIQ